MNTARQAAVDVLRTITSIHRGQPADELVTDTWTAGLDGLSTYEAVQATHAVLKRSKFLPTIAEVREVAMAARAELRAAQEAQARQQAARELPDERVFDPYAREVLGRIKRRPGRPSPLDGCTYCMKDLVEIGKDAMGVPNRFSVAAFTGDPSYLTLHGNADPTRIARKITAPILRRLDQAISA